MRMSYLIVAADPRTITLCTRASVDWARPDPACAWISAPNFRPFCNSFVFCPADVFPEKNASQFCVIIATAPVGLCEGGELELELEQAARSAITTAERTHRRVPSMCPRAHLTTPSSIPSLTPSSPTRRP